MDNTEKKTVLEMIEEKYDQIYSAEKKVADFILENPEKTVNANVSELANFSGVSDSTVIRLCKHIGYQGYYQLRLSLSRDLGRTQNGSVPEQKEKVNNVSEVFQDYASKIVDIGKNIGEEKMQRCVDMIKGCNYLHIVAAGNTSPLAKYMGFRLGRLGIRCTYNELPEYFLNNVNLARKGDIVFAISQSGSSKHVVQALELAKEKGLEIIAITAYEYSPVSRLADCLLLSSVEKLPFDYYKSYSHLNETAVIDGIMHFVMNEAIIQESNADIPEIILSEYKL